VDERQFISTSLLSQLDNRERMMDLANGSSSSYYGTVNQDRNFHQHLI
jgi:hypothetical protein